MRLFRLVEEHHAIGTPAHRLGEASAVTIANVTGRSAHEPGRGLRVAVFAQVDTDEGAGLAPHATLGGEHLLGEHPGRLGLAHAARAGEQERGKGPLSAEPGVVAPDGPGNGGDGIPVPDDPFLQPPLECEKPIAFGLQDPLLRNSREPRHRAGHVVARDLRPALATGPRSGEIDGGERLVGQTAIVHVPGGEERRGLQRLGREADPVVLLVPGRGAGHDLQRLAWRRLADQHRDEPALEGGIALHVAAELLVGRRADAGEFAARQRSLQLVRGILRPIPGGAGPDQHVHLVDEDDDATVRTAHFFLDPLQPLAERAAKLRAGDERRNVELHQDSIRARLDQAPRQAFHDGRLAHAGLADEQRVVRAPLAEDVEDLLDFRFAPHRRIEDASCGESAQVPAEGSQIGLLPGIELVPRRRALDRALPFGLRRRRGGGRSGRGGRARGVGRGYRWPGNEGGARVGLHLVWLRASPRNRSGEIAEGRGAQRGDGNGALQELPTRGAREPGQSDEEMEVARAIASAVVGELPGPLEGEGERAGRLRETRRQGGEDPILVAAALAQERVGRARDGEDGEEQVRGGGIVPGRSGDVARLGGDERELGRVLGDGHRRRASSQSEIARRKRLPRSPRRC